MNATHHYAMHTCFAGEHGLDEPCHPRYTASSLTLKGIGKAEFLADVFLVCGTSSDELVYKAVQNAIYVAANMVAEQENKDVEIEVARLQARFLPAEGWIVPAQQTP